MIDNHTALLLIDVQEGFKDPYWGRRNNSCAEGNIKTLLQRFRQKGLPVIHIQHLSTDPNSPLRVGHSGANLMPETGPSGTERLFTKHVNSAFIGTDLESYLRSEKISSLILVGLTSDHCVSTSARMAANLGFKVTVISDATATFERRSISGELLSADLIHQVSLASLNGEFARILGTEQLLTLLSESVG